MLSVAKNIRRENQQARCAGVVRHARKPRRLEAAVRIDTVHEWGVVAHRFEGEIERIREALIESGLLGAKAGRDAA